MRHLTFPFVRFRTYISETSDIDVSRHLCYYCNVSEKRSIVRIKGQDDSTVYQVRNVTNKISRYYFNTSKEQENMSGLTALTKDPRSINSNHN